jgi:prepilin-type N-terminal cleavage/methylation domain-containing protein
MAIGVLACTVIMTFILWAPMAPRAETTTFAAGNEQFMNASKNRGFTLLELALVLLVIGLVAAVTIPSLARGYASMQLRASGRDVLNVFRQAKEKAVTEQTEMQVTIDPSKHEFILTDEVGDGEKRFSLPKEVIISRVSFAGSDVVQGPVFVRFLPNGSSDAAEVEIKPERGGPSIVIATDPIAGGARIKTSAGENNR